MKRKLFLLFLSFVLLTSILPLSAYAVQVQLIDLDFTDGAASESVSGLTWNGSGSMFYLCGKASFADSSWIELSSLESADIINIINNDQDIYWWYKFI